jgi:coenzyme F420-reducing hydrogenase delta subunit
MITQAADSCVEVEIRPHILVFSTSTISDIGIDLAGSIHLHYSPTVVSIPISCSSGIRPEWILFALNRGFDGVFIAADGTDCPFLADCTARTARIVGRTQELMREQGIAPERLKMAAICSVCAEPFARHMQQFADSLIALVPKSEAG